MVIKLIECPKCKSTNISRVETHITGRVFTQQSNGDWIDNPFHDAVDDDPEAKEKFHLCDDCENEF